MKKILPESVSAFTATSKEFRIVLFLLKLINMMALITRSFLRDDGSSLVEHQEIRKTEVFCSYHVAHYRELAQLAFTFLRFFFRIQTPCIRKICLFISILYLH